MRIAYTLVLGLTLSGAPAAAQQQAQQIAVGSVPRGLAFHPSRNQLVVSSFGDNSVVVVDLATLRARTVTSVQGAAGVAVDDELGLAVVTNASTNQVAIVDLATLEIVDRIPVESTPYSVDINPATHIAVVSNSNSRTLSLVDLRARRVVATVPDVPAQFDGVQTVAVHSGVNMAVVANTQINAITLVDLSTRRVVATVNVGARPVAVAVNPATNIAVVCNASGNSVSIVDLGARRLLDDVPINSPQGVAIHHPSNTAIISSTLSNEVVLLDLSNNRVIDRATSLTSPMAAAASAFSRRAAVVLPANNSIALMNIPAASTLSMVGGASFQAHFAPGMIVCGFGSGLAADTRTATALPLPTRLGNTAVRIGSRLLPLFFVSPAQVDFQLPFDVTGRQTVEVLRDNTVVASGEIVIAAASPELFTRHPGVNTALNTSVTGGAAATVTPASMAGILPGMFLLVGAGTTAEVVRVTAVTETAFTAYFALAHARGERVAGAQTGVGPLAALNQDGSPVSIDGCISRAQPAPANSVVLLFGTGHGVLAPALTAGAAAPASPLSRTASTPEVRLGGVPVTVEFSGAAPGFAGLWQINIRIPDPAPSGTSVPVSVTLNGFSSLPLGTLAVAGSGVQVQPCRR